MGYYTKFSLKVTENYNTLQGLALEEKLYARLRAYKEAIEHFPDIETLVALTNRDTDSWKWYEYEEDMKKISVVYPELFFELNGEGEESGDIWKAYFRNGKSQICKATLQFEPYDEKKMK